MVQERGNVELIKHYIQIFESAFLIRSLQKFRSSSLTSRLSSPKILPLAPALITQLLGQQTLSSPIGGRVFESIVGADLANIPNSELYYWREKNDEVDFVLVHSGQVYGVEVKSGRKKGKGLAAFSAHVPKAKLKYVSKESYAAFCQDPLQFLK